MSIFVCASLCVGDEGILGSFCGVVITVIHNAFYPSFKLKSVKVHERSECYDDLDCIISLHLGQLAQQYSLLSLCGARTREACLLSVKARAGMLKHKNRAHWPGFCVLTVGVFQRNMLYIACVSLSLEA